MCSTKMHKISGYIRALKRGRGGGRGGGRYKRNLASEGLQWGGINNSGLTKRELRIVADSCGQYSRGIFIYRGLSGEITARNTKQEHFPLIILISLSLSLSLLTFLFCLSVLHTIPLSLSYLDGLASRLERPVCRLYMFLLTGL